MEYLLGKTADIIDIINQWENDWEDIWTVIGKGFRTQLRSSSNHRKLVGLNLSKVDLSSKKLPFFCPKLRCLLVGGWPTPLKNNGVSSSVGMMTYTFPIWWESHLGIPWFQSPPTRWCIPNLQVCPFQNIAIWWDMGSRSQIWPTRCRRRHPRMISQNDLWESQQKGLQQL